MHVVQYPVRQRVQRRMYLPSERMVVNGVGLGEVDGFNVGKMFNRMFTFRKGSFKPGNIMGALGSGFTNLMTFGTASAFAPKTFGAHSSSMKKVGMGVAAAAAATGAYFGGSALLGSGFGSSLASGAGTLLKGAGSVLKGAGSVLKGGMEVLSAVGGSRGSGGMSAADMAALQQQQVYLAQEQQQQQQATYNAQQQAAYEAQQLQQAQYGTNIPVSEQLTPTVYPTMSGGTPSGSYGPYAQDMQVSSPYSPLTDNELLQVVDPTTGLVTDPTTGNKINPGTGQIVQIGGKVAQAGMFPQLTPATWAVVGGTMLLGWYLMSEKK